MIVKELQEERKTMSVLARDERAVKRAARRDYYFQPPP
jgi:hypothetical protein